MMGIQPISSKQNGYGETTIIFSAQTQQHLTLEVVKTITW